MALSPGLVCALAVGVLVGGAVAGFAVAGVRFLRCGLGVACGPASGLCVSRGEGN